MIQSPALNAALDIDVPCIACGYNLRGLSRDGRCPECAGDIASSIARYEAELARREPPLSMSSLRWVRTLARGCLLILLAAAIDVCAVGLLIGMLESSIPHLTIERLMPVWLIPPALLAGGIWAITSAELGAAWNPERRWARRLLRGCVLFLLVLDLFLFGTTSFSRNRIPNAGWQVGMTVRALFASTITFGSWTQLARLLGRAGLGRSQRCAAILHWVGPTVTLVQLLFFGWVNSNSVRIYIRPQPLIGDFRAPALVGYRLLTMGDVEPSDAFAIVVAASSACAIGLLIYAWRRFAGIACASKRPVVQPAGHE